MYTNTRQQIVEIIEKNENVRVKDLVKKLGITAAAVHRALNKLQKDNIIEKKGTPPLVFYSLKQRAKNKFVPDIPVEEKKILQDHYLYITPTGNVISGVDGFLTWMRETKNNQGIENCIKDYSEVFREAESHKNSNGLIDATERFNKIFEKVYLDKVFYFDFYSLVKFGKTKIGQYLLHGKQAQNKRIIEEIALQVKKSLKALVRNEKIDAIAWVPHSIPRKVPFLKELASHLQIELPEIEIVKVYQGDIPIAQKSLSKIEERIKNAEQTMVVVPLSIKYKRVLLIDDAVGSGSTLNEVAKKLKAKGVLDVVGFSIVGSYKGFEVIKEV